MNMAELIKSEVQRYLSMKLELQDFGQLKEDILAQAAITEVIREIEKVLDDEKETNTQELIEQLRVIFLQKQATQDATTQEQLRLEKMSLESRLPSTRQQLLTLEQRLEYTQSLMMGSELNLNSKTAEINFYCRRIHDLESQARNLKQQLVITQGPIVYSHQNYTTVTSEYNGTVLPYSQGMATPTPIQSSPYLYWQEQQIQEQLFHAKSNLSSLQREYENFERDFQVHQRAVKRLESNIRSMKSDVSSMERRIPEIAGLLQIIESRRQLDNSSFSLNRLSFENQRTYQQQANKIEQETETFFQSQLKEAKEKCYGCFIKQLKLTELPNTSRLHQIIEQMKYHQSDLTDLKEQKQTLEYLRTQLNNDEIALKDKEKKVQDNQFSLDVLVKEIESLTHQKPELKTQAAKLLALADSQKYIALGVGGATTIFAVSTAFMFFILSAPVSVIATLSVACLVSGLTSGIFAGMRWYNQSKAKGCEEQIVKNLEKIESDLQRCEELKSHNKEINEVTIPKLESDIYTLKQTRIPEQEAIVEEAEQKARISYQEAAAIPHSQLLKSEEMLLIDLTETMDNTNSPPWYQEPVSPCSSVSANLSKFGHFGQPPSATNNASNPLDALFETYYKPH